MLLPRELDMVEAGKHMPLPAPKPKIPELEARKKDGKHTVGRGEGDTPARPHRNNGRSRWRS
jgi:hypothetical protein